MATKPRVKVPKTASAGEVITIKTLIAHRMESGVRMDREGNIIPRMIINRFTATFNGQPVFEADMHSAISANPYMEFSARVEESGTFRFTWVDDEGTVYTTKREITIA